MCVRVCVCVYGVNDMCVYFGVSACVDIYMCVCVCVGVYGVSDMCVYFGVSACVNIYIYMCVCVCVYVYLIQIARNQWNYFFEILLEKRAHF